MAQAANDLRPDGGGYDPETVTVGLLLQVAGYADDAAAKLADEELERRVIAGSPPAITGTMCSLYGLWRAGELPYPQFRDRACWVMSAAFRHRRLSAVFAHIGDQWAADEAHAEFLFLLDQMASSAPDEATKEDAAAAIVEAKAYASSAAFEAARKIRYDQPQQGVDMSMDPSPPPVVDFGTNIGMNMADLSPDTFADLIPAPAPPPIAWHYVDQPDPSRWERCRWWLMDRAWDVRFWLEGVTLWSILTLRPVRHRWRAASLWFRFDLLGRARWWEAYPVVEPAKDPHEREG